MTIDELERLQRGVEEAAGRRGPPGRSGAAAFGETVAVFRRFAGLARHQLMRGDELAPRLSSALRALAAMLLGTAPDSLDGGAPRGTLADGGGHVLPGSH